MWSSWRLIRSGGFGSPKYAIINRRDDSASTIFASTEEVDTTGISRSCRARCISRSAGVPFSRRYHRNGAPRTSPCLCDYEVEPLLDWRHLPWSFEVRIPTTFVTPGQSVPEPDAAVCSVADAARKPQPSRAELIVVVASSSIDEDRALAEEYAAAQVQEYWVVDVDRRCVEVYRHPIEDKSAKYGHRYSEIRMLNIGERISPMGHVDDEMPVSLLFIRLTCKFGSNIFWFFCS